MTVRRMRVVTQQWDADLASRRGALVLCSLLAAACGSSSRDVGSGSPSAPAAIESFTSAASAVHVGERTQLTAVFTGESASIDGIGPVESGTSVATPALARTTTFTLTVRRGSQTAEARLSIAAIYRDRFRQLSPAPVAYTQHVATALADGGALVMGGNTSESPNVPDTDSSHRFDPVTETVSPGPRLAFSAEADLTTPILEPAWRASTATLLRNGKVLVFGGEDASGFPVSTVMLYE